MKILLVHNYYQQRGGEDAVFEAEAALLASYDHEVVRYTAHNDEVERHSTLSLAARTVWNPAAYADLLRLLERERPAVVHVHNTLPLISPAVYYAARQAGIPVVQTLHNYRIVCPGGLLFRNGRPCEDCLTRTVALPGIRYGCYRQSRLASAAVATMLGAHQLARTWTRRVDLFIALTQFARGKFIAGGLDPERVIVKPNFTRDPGLRSTGGGYGLFVGRLAPEKGYEVLLKAWSRLGDRLPLVVIGDGPGADAVRRAADRHPSIQYWGRRSAAEVGLAMAGARFLVFPSIWYETFGLTIIEAFAAGLPVVGSRLGAGMDLVAPGRTGLHFTAGDSEDLARQVEWALDHEDEMAVMGRNARLEYEARYTPEQNYQMLMAVYDRVRGRRQRPSHPPVLAVP